MSYLNVKNTTLIQIEEKKGYVHDLKTREKQEKSRISVLLHTEENPINQEEK